MAAKHDTDFYAWTQETAQAIREQRWSDLDVEDLLDEIESMGNSERREIESRLEILLSHLLKQQYQPEKRTRSWDLTLKEQRLKVSQLFEQNPSLRARQTGLIQSAYLVACVRAARETGLDEDVFPATCPWTPEEVVSKP